MEPSREIFDAVRAGDTGRLQALLRANPGLVNVRNERGHTPVLIAQYRDKPDAVALLLAAEPELDIFDAASVGRTARVAEWLDRDPGLLNARSSDGFSYGVVIHSFPVIVANILVAGVAVVSSFRKPSALASPP